MVIYVGGAQIFMLIVFKNRAGQTVETDHISYLFIFVFDHVGVNNVFPSDKKVFDLLIGPKVVNPLLPMTLFRRQNGTFGVARAALQLGARP